jgi:hypothetical protein
MTAFERDMKRVNENVPSAMRLLEQVITTGCIWLSYYGFFYIKKKKIVSKLDIIDKKKI